MLKARGFQPGSAPAVPLEKLDHEVRGYSPEALAALSAAIRDATNRSRTLVGVEDMLIGILSPPSNEVAQRFKEKNVSPEKLLAEIRKQS